MATWRGFFLPSFAFLGLSTLTINTLSTVQGKESKRLETLQCSPVGAAGRGCREGVQPRPGAAVKDCSHVLSQSGPRNVLLSKVIIKLQNSVYGILLRRGRSNKNVHGYFPTLKSNVQTVTHQGQEGEVCAETRFLHMCLSLWLWNCVMTKPEVNQFLKIGSKMKQMILTVCQVGGLTTQKIIQVTLKPNTLYISSNGKKSCKEISNCLH